MTIHECVMWSGYQVRFFMHHEMTQGNLLGGRRDAQVI